MKERKKEIKTVRRKQKKLDDYDKSSLQKDEEERQEK
jgi:hypothetical protein